jgi:hypothetical protein
MKTLSRGNRATWILLGALLVVFVVICVAFRGKQPEFKLKALANTKPVEHWPAVKANRDTDIYCIRRDYAEVAEEVSQELSSSKSGWSVQWDKGRCYFLRPPEQAGDNDVNYMIVYRGQWTVRPRSRMVEAISQEQQAWTTIYVYHRYNKLTWLAKKWHAATRAMGIR